MMNYIYVRRNIPAEQFNPPVVAGSDELAFRVFLGVFGMPSMLDRHDTKFYRIGMWNNETGAIEGTEPVEVTDAYYDFIDKLIEFQKEQEALHGEKSN